MFQRISYDEANPGLTGFRKGLDMSNVLSDLITKHLAQQKSREQLPYVGPQAKANLLKQQLENTIQQPYADQAQPFANAALRLANAQPDEILARAGLQRAQAGAVPSEVNLRNTQAKEIAFKLAHPQYLDAVGYYIDQLQKNGGRPGQQNSSPYAQQQGNQGDDQSGQPMQPNASSGNPMSAPGNPGVNPQQSNAGPQQPPTNNAPQQQYGDYGITAPQLSPGAYDPLANKILGTTPSDAQQLKNYSDQVTDQRKQYQQSIMSSVKESEAANDIDQDMDVFNNAMTNSFYKGSKLGTVSSEGGPLTSIATLGYNFSNEQLADKAAARMLIASVSKLRDAMGSARFSNLDLGQAKNLTFSRTMDDNTRKSQTLWLKSINSRMKEKPQFYALLNSQAKAPKWVADILWQQYQNNYPLIDKTGSVLTGNLDKWSSYTTPEAIQSAREGKNYYPTVKKERSKSEENTNVRKWKLVNGELVEQK